VVGVVEEQHKVAQADHRVGAVAELGERVGAGVDVGDHVDPHTVRA
jgi:hypothetical protein